MKKRCFISAFSLVEVVLAIGIISFALLAVIGLLPVGMKSAQNSREQAAAANVMNGIANALRCAETVDGTNFSSSYAGESFEYEIGGASTTVEWTLDLNGQPVGDGTWARLKALLIITPPSTPVSNGDAVISIAWPAQSPNLEWNGTNWDNAQGQVATRLQFLSRR